MGYGCYYSFSPSAKSKETTHKHDAKIIISSICPCTTAEEKNTNIVKSNKQLNIFFARNKQLSIA